MNVEIVSCKDDGEIEKDDSVLKDFEYLHVDIKVDGETEGSLSGFFKPELAAFIRKALTQYAEDHWTCDCGSRSCRFCGEDLNNLVGKPSRA